MHTTISFLFVLLLTTLLCMSSQLWANEIANAIEQKNQPKAIDAIKKAAEQYPGQLDEINESGNAPIHLAIHEGFDDVVRALIKYHADLTIKNDRGEDPVYLAFRLKREAIQNMLLEAGAQVNYSFLSQQVSRITLTPKPVHTKLRSGSVVEKYSRLFKSNIEKFLGDDIKLQQLVYLQPLFSDEKWLYSQLLTFVQENRNKYENTVRKFLYYQAQAGYPNGSKNALAAGLELDALKAEAKHSPELDKAMLKQISASIDKRASKGLFRAEGSLDKFDYMSLSAERIAKLFTIRDNFLVRDVTLQQIRNWADNSARGHAIIALGNHFDLTARFIAFTLVSAKEKPLRFALVEHWMDVGYELYRLRNYHGVMQILSAINRQSVMRLFGNEEKLYNGISKKILKKYEEYYMLWDMSGDYSIHRQLIKAVPSEKPCLAPYPMVMHDLAMMLEKLQGTRAEGELDFEKLTSLVKLIKEIVDHRNKANYQFNDVDNEFKLQLKLVSNLPNIENETLEEISSLVQEWNFARTDPKEKLLEEWDSSEFVFWLTNNGMKEFIEPLFALRIFTGKELIKFFENEKGYFSQLDVLRQKLNIPYNLGARLITLSSPRPLPEKKRVTMWDCLDVALWFSNNPLTLEKLFRRNLSTGKNLIDQLDGIPQGYAQIAVLSGLGFSTLEAKLFIALLDHAAN